MTITKQLVLPRNRLRPRRLSETRQATTETQGCLERHPGLGGEGLGHLSGERSAPASRRGPGRALPEGWPDDATAPPPRLTPSPTTSSTPHGHARCALRRASLLPRLRIHCPVRALVFGCRSRSVTRDAAANRQDFARGGPRRLRSAGTTPRAKAPRGDACSPGDTIGSRPPVLRCPARRARSSARAPWPAKGSTSERHPSGEHRPTRAGRSPPRVRPAAARPAPGSALSAPQSRGSEPIANVHGATDRPRCGCTPPPAAVHRPSRLRSSLPGQAAGAPTSRRPSARSAHRDPMKGPTT
jgi:hypothetical protein